MDNQYQYRKHIRYMRKIAAIGFVAVIVAIWLFVLVLKIFFGEGSIEVVVPMLIFSLFLGGEAIFLWIFLGRFTKVRVTFGSEAITYTNYKGDTVITYEDITKIQFPSIKYTGGWIKIVAGKTDIRLTVVVENIQTLLLKLKGELDKRGLSDKYNADKFFSFLKTSAYADNSWQRIYRIWWKLIILTVVTTAAGIVAGKLFDFGSFRTYLSGLISFIFPTIIYGITEIIFGRSTAKLSNRDSFSVPVPDLEYERTIYKQAVLWGAILYLALLGVGVVFR